MDSTAIVPSGCEKSMTTLARGSTGRSAAQRDADLADPCDFAGILTDSGMLRRFQGRDDGQIAIFARQLHDPLAHPAGGAIDGNEGWHVRCSLRVEFKWPNNLIKVVWHLHGPIRIGCRRTPALAQHIIKRFLIGAVISHGRGRVFQLVPGEDADDAGRSGRSRLLAQLFCARYTGSRCRLAAESPGADLGLGIEHS